MASYATGPIVIAPAADLPDWAKESIDLANPRLGASALYASDDFFAEVARLLNPEPAQFVPGKYDSNGKWMDGWESRHKRVAGHDYALIKLGVKGRIRGFDVDTSHFIGNYPPAVSIDAALCESDEIEHLRAAVWNEILPSSELGPNRHHLLEACSDAACMRLRVNIYPDCGIALLRVYGEAVGGLDNIVAGERVDLIALHNGGRPLS